LQFVRLLSLMERTSGRPDLTLGLIDGPVAFDHPDLKITGRVTQIPGRKSAACSVAASAACVHGTFVAGVLSARRGSSAPAICPGCTLLVRPIFTETTPGNGDMPGATPEELAEAIVDCVSAGARVLNLSVALRQSSLRGKRQLEEALNYAASRQVITVVAAGNQGTLVSSTLTQHPSVIPVAGCDLQGRPLGESNLGSSIGRLGTMAPGQGVTSLFPSGEARLFRGTSVAAPFATGTIALLWSEFPDATATEVKLAVTRLNEPRRKSIVPSVLNAWAAYEAMASIRGRRFAS
jgi:subtilisin family serine protease